MKISSSSLSLSFFEKRIFNNASFEISGPGIVKIEGENGSGKTTFLDVIAGFILPTRGKVYSSVNQGMIGYLPQESSLFERITLQDNFNLIAEGKLFSLPEVETRGSLLDRGSYELLLDELNVRPLLNVPVAKLSGGERKKADLIAAFIGEPQIILIDEPYNGLDRHSISNILPVLTELSRTRLLIMTDHTNRGPESRQTILISQGKIVDVSNEK